MPLCCLDMLQKLLIMAEGSGSPVGGSPCDCVGWKRRRPSDVRKLLWDDRQREPGGEEGMEGIK